MPNKIRDGPHRSLAELHRATDTLSTMLSQEVRELHARQKAARRQDQQDPGAIKALKETTAVLKDLASVARALNEQGAAEAEEAVCGVVLLPRVDGEEDG